MTLRDQVLQTALGLPPEDRAFVVAALELSLESADSEDVPSVARSAQELLNELQRRSAAYRSGLTTARPAADILAELRKQVDEARK